MGHVATPDFRREVFVGPGPRGKPQGNGQVEQGARRTAEAVVGDLVGRGRCAVRRGVVETAGGPPPPPPPGGGKGKPPPEKGVHPGRGGGPPTRGRAPAGLRGRPPAPGRDRTG